MNKNFASNKEALFAKGGTKESANAAPILNAKPGRTFTTQAATAANPVEKKRVSLEKLKEADDWRLKGVKALKTSIFGNWKPDYLMAAPYFERAANTYKGTGADDQAKAMYIKAAECQEHCGAYATAALDMQKAAAIAKDEDDEEAGRYLSKEAEYWILSGDVGRAADAFMRAATIVEDSSPSTAIEFTISAVDILCPDEGGPVELSKAPMASDVFTKALNLCVRAERIPEALTVATKAGKVLENQQLHTSLYKMYCVQTILALLQGDLVLADKTFMEVHLQNSGYIRSNESEVAENLIRAGKAMSAEALQDALNDLNKAYLDNNIVRIAKRLTIEKIAGLGAEEDGVESPRVGSSLPPSVRGGTKRAAAAGGDDVPMEDVDPDMELSEEEKAKLRSFNAAYAPKPSVAPRAAPAPQPDPMERAESQSGMMDLSDLQAELDNAGYGGDDDLDAAIREAREAANRASNADAEEEEEAPLPQEEFAQPAKSAVVDHHGPPKPPRHGSAGAVHPPPPPPPAEDDDDDDLLR